MRRSICFELLLPWISLVVLQGCSKSSPERNASDLHPSQPPQTSLINLITQFAGEYYFGDGKGVNCTLQLKGDSTFAFEWTGCLGVYDQNDGYAEIEDNLIRLIPTKPNLKKGFKGIDTELLPVAWDQRKYLIPTDQILEFCSAVNQGNEPRNQHYGLYYLRRGDWAGNAVGFPTLPEKWKAYLLSKPVEGKVVEIETFKVGWINLGTEDGILEGMTLVAGRREPLILPADVIVTSAGPRKSKVRVSIEEFENIVLGEKVSSRSPLH